MGDMSKAFFVGGVALFFILLSIFTLNINNEMGNTAGISDIILSNATASPNIQNTGVLETSILSVWDYMINLIDIFTIGYFFSTIAEITLFANLIILLPLRIAFFWVVIELIRGN